MHFPSCCFLPKQYKGIIQKAYKKKFAKPFVYFFWNTLIHKSLYDITVCKTINIKHLLSLNHFLLSAYYDDGKPYFFLAFFQKLIPIYIHSLTHLLLWLYYIHTLDIDVIHQISIRTYLCIERWIVREYVMLYQIQYCNIFCMIIDIKWQWSISILHAISNQVPAWYLSGFKLFCVLLHQEYETITSFYVYLLVRKNVHTTSDHRLIYIRTLMCIVSKDEDRRYAMRGYAVACKNGK